MGEIVCFLRDAHVQANRMAIQESLERPGIKVMWIASCSCLKRSISVTAVNGIPVAGKVDGENPDCVGLTNFPVMEW